MKHAINCQFITQVMANGERSVAIWEGGKAESEPWDIKFCPFCGAKL
jgi:hypothetical protein